MTTARRYPTERGLQTAINQRINERARALKRPPAELHREFFMQRMLARVFLDPESSWILKGGTSLLVRIPGARHSQDIDLLHLHTDLEEAFSELRDLVSAPSHLDPFTFTLQVDSRSDNEGTTQVWKLRATPMLGPKQLQHFPIDLTAGKELVGAIDYITPTPTIDIDDVLPSPRLACYPLADQIADKVAAMYEYHGEAKTPSSRWRDLVDLLLIIRTCEFDAALLHRSLEHQHHHRPTLDLPTEIVMPGPRWKESYPATARKVRALPAELHVTDAAFSYLGRCMNPILDRSIGSGTWDPYGVTWRPGP